MRVFAVSALAGGAALLLGCSSGDASDKEDVSSYDSELRLASPHYLGPIADGQTKSSYYSDPPKYRAYGFHAKGGDKITVDVSSVDGDAMGWITDSSYSVLASNDDASSSTLDSRVTYKVPTGTADRAYRIVFRDYDRLDATFSVSLDIKSASGGSGSSCDPSNELDRNYLGTPKSCATLRYTCSSGTHPFSNACGCGCEDD